ncbi:hypothetical protein ACA910_012409 [Epithemia clementina (nom. ined.)]
MGRYPHSKDAPHKAKTILYLGASGVVHCTGGQGMRSCQNLVVHINQARRACFGDDSNNNRKQKLDCSSFLKRHPRKKCRPCNRRNRASDEDAAACSAKVTRVAAFHNGRQAVTALPWAKLTAFQTACGYLPKE